MEADWEVEIGDEAPVIDACWEGLVDLRGAPELARQLLETRQFPSLADALQELNSACSPVWTSKCDVWSPGQFDLDEMHAKPEEGKCAIACYIDLLPISERQWPSPTEAVAWCRALCVRLRNVPLRCCRADLIIRRAHIAEDGEDLGITLYLSAAGSTRDSARDTLESALAVLVESVLQSEHPANPAAKLQ